MDEGNERETIPDLAAEVERLRAELAAADASTNEAYADRNMVVAFAARLSMAVGWRVGTGPHQGDDTGWEEAWRNVVFIDTPAGQLSWHYHADHGFLFEGLPAYGRPWDRHTTDEKYDRLETVVHRMDEVNARMRRMIGE